MTRSEPITGASHANQDYAHYVNPHVEVNVKPGFPVLKEGKCYIREDSDLQPPEPPIYHLPELDTMPFASMDIPMVQPGSPDK